MTKNLSTKGAARRDFVRKAAYIAPAILTLAAAPDFAKAGSVKGGVGGGYGHPTPPVTQPPKS